jgi:hypothetical protein
VSDAWYDRIYLEDEQRELLSWMVEAERATGQRERFILVGTMDGYLLIYPGYEDRPAVNQGDLVTLAERDLLRQSYGSGRDPLYELTPEGRRYYAELQRRAGEATAVVEDQVHRFLDAGAFAAAFPGTYARWRDAERALWDAEDVGQLTEIGHVCREAMQAFADDLAKRAGIEGMPADPAKTVDRIRAVIGAKVKGDTRQAFARALLAYWGTVSDLVHRQEHGAGKEGEQLTWEDARTVVFQTAIVMYEIARAVADT